MTGIEPSLLTAAATTRIDEGKSFLLCLRGLTDAKGPAFLFRRCDARLMRGFLAALEALLAAGFRPRTDLYLLSLGDSAPGLCARVRRQCAAVIAPGRPAMPPAYPVTLASPVGRDSLLPLYFSAAKERLKKEKRVPVLRALVRSLFRGPRRGERFPQNAFTRAVLKSAGETELRGVFPPAVSGGILTRFSGIPRIGYTPTHPEFFYLALLPKFEQLTADDP